MGRELKRVPMGFDWPLGKVWDGFIDCREVPAKYLFDSCKDCRNGFSPHWDACRGRLSHGKILDKLKAEGLPWKCETCDGSGYDCSSELLDESYMWKAEWVRTDPPAGDGFQMWETTTEGSPQTPVFGTLPELAEYCSSHCTTFATRKTSADSWEKMLADDLVTTVIAPGVIAI